MTAMDVQRSWLIAVAAAVAAPAAAQTLAERVADAQSGSVRLSFAARDGVCGDGHGVWTRSHGDKDWSPVCDDGPVRVQIERDGTRIVRIRTHVGGSWQPRDDVTTLGDVDAAEASAFFLDVAVTARPSVAEDAIVAAVMADAPDPWRRLLALARDDALHEDVREQAMFWLGQSAAREATEGLAAIVNDDATTEVQKAAVFALSQRDEPERIDRLIDVARRHRNPEVVEAALFWLADSADERAVDLFEELLGGETR